MRSITISELKSLEGGCWNDWMTENLCPSPISQWWASFFARWGAVQDLPEANNGAFSQFWDDSNTFCFYDSSDTLLGRFVRDERGEFVLTGDGKDIRSSTKFTLSSLRQERPARTQNRASVLLRPADA